jgi:5'-nucleotidase
VVTERKGADDATALLSAGDNIGASEFSSYIDEDNPTLDYLGALGLEASAAGNHEYDAGFEDFDERVRDRADFPYLAVNVYQDDQRTTDPYAIVDADGVKVAVVGAVTQETPSLTSPTGLAGVEFRDPVDSVNDAIEELESSGDDYDVLVVEYHEGSSGSADAGGVPQETAVFRHLVQDTAPEVDAIFTAHTHQTYAYLADVPGEDGRQRPVVQTGSYGANLGKVVLTEDADGEWSASAQDVSLVPTADTDTATCEGDETYDAATAIAADATEKGEEEGSKPIGSVAADVTTAFMPGDASYQDGFWTRDTTERGDDRASSSALSDELADSMVWAVNQDDYTGPKATIGVMNPGGVRANLDYAASGDEGDGVVTVREANDVVPFVNNLGTVELTGEQFVQVLEQQWQRDENGEVPSREYLQLGLSQNVDYTFDETADEGEHITSVTIDGEALDPEATYTIVAASFLVDGGDNFWAFQDGTNVTDTGLVDRDAWFGYLEENEDLEPDFSQRGVEVSSLNEGTGAEDDPWTVQVRGLESRSLGAPEITTATVTIDGEDYSADYGEDEDGALSATIDLYVPVCSEAGPVDAVITAEPDTGTAVTYPVEITRDGDLPEECDGGTDPTPEPTDEPTDEPTSDRPSSSSPAGSDPATTAPSTSPTSSPTAGGALPSTGATVAPYLVGAGILVLLGLGALVLRRYLRKG